jgi:hypothetical protein
MRTCDAHVSHSELCTIETQQEKTRIPPTGGAMSPQERCQEEAAADHVFGVPFFLFAGEPFWGYDWLPLLEQRLKKAGLAIADKVTTA